MYMASYELYHHGILGMHWGIRRYQNKDGTWTAAGKKRYGGDQRLLDIDESITRRTKMNNKEPYTKKGDTRKKANLASIDAKISETVLSLDKNGAIKQAYSNYRKLNAEANNAYKKAVENARKQAGGDRDKLYGLLDKIDRDPKYEKMNEKARQAYEKASNTARQAVSSMLGKIGDEKMTDFSTYYERISKSDAVYKVVDRYLSTSYNELSSTKKRPVK